MTTCIHLCLFPLTHTRTHAHTYAHTRNYRHNPVFTLTFLYNPVFSVLVKFIEAEFTFSEVHNSMRWDKCI